MTYFNTTTKNQELKQLQFQFAYNTPFPWVKFSIAILFLILAALLTIPLYARAIEDRIAQPATEKTAKITFQTIDENDRLVYDVVVDTGGQAINLVGAYIDFATSSATLEKIDLENSFCELVIENSIDNEFGQARIFCGKPFPGANGILNVGQLTFKKITNDTPVISFGKETMVLANDGLGTDVLKR